MRLDQATDLRLSGVSALRAFLNGSTVWESIIPISATGGTVFDIPGFRVHAFYSSGDFVVTNIPAGASDQVEYLIVGGGGSGGQGGGGAGGGGGGGGVLTGTATITASTYPVVVGAGGAASGAQVRGNPGSPSTFAGLSASGGGGGGRTETGGSGGSGGGGAPGKAGGAGIVGQGHNGTAGLLTGVVPNRTFAGGGGGGAATIAITADIAVKAGSGGTGLTSTITGMEISYAGGGGGAFGRDSTGGGWIEPGESGDDSAGDGGRNIDGKPAAPYRGGGGGGGGLTSDTGLGGAAGGSGVVVIRYPHNADALAYTDPPQPTGWESADTALRVSNQVQLIRNPRPGWGYVFTPYGCVTADGTLLLAYRSGAAHHSPGRTEIMRGRHRPYSWETPHWPATPDIIIDPPAGYDDVRDAKLLTLPNGNILLAYCVQLSTDLTSHSRVRISTDGGVTFGAEIDPQATIPTWTGKFVIQGPEVRDDGSIIMPVWGEKTPGALSTAAIIRSTDGGETWAHLSDVASNGVEPEIVAGTAASEWLCFYRGGIKKSTDDGLTWAAITTDLTISNWVKPVRSSLTGALVANIRNLAVTNQPPYVTLGSADATTWTTPLAAGQMSAQQLGAFIYERSPGVFTLVHAVGGGLIVCSLLEELPQ